MDDSSPPGPDSTGDGRATVSHRIVALLEVLICSDYPTQLAVGNTFAAFGYAPAGAGGTLNLSFVAGVSAIDTAFLLALILAFIGVKLILHFVHLHDYAVPEISTGLSLAVIGTILAIVTIASRVTARRDPTLRAHAGRLREARFLGGDRRSLPRSLRRPKHRQVRHANGN